MLIERLKQDEILKYFIVCECHDLQERINAKENIKYSLFTSISFERDKILILAIDEFYNSLPKKERIKSPDFLILQLCGENYYNITLIEFKNIKSPSYITIKDIREKFENCLQDFMSNRFRNYFYDLSYNFKVKLFLVAGQISEKKIKNFKFDFLLGDPYPLEFGNKKLGIQGIHPYPTITSKDCK